MPYLDQNAIIPKAKLTKYLLVRLPKDDKSLFLAKAGYTLENWQQLAEDIKTQILPLEATPSFNNEFGQKYEIDGEIIGINGVVLAVTTVWIKTPTETRFVTLVPRLRRIK
ncbi:MAG: hypothetical protein VKL42_08345 [Snowella sp.]|nr:hypothetical protein [Snowella sp.]